VADTRKRIASAAAVAWARRWPRRTTAAIVIVIAGAAFAASAIRMPEGAGFGDPEAPAQVQTLLAGVFSPDRCVRTTEAEESIRKQLDQSNYSGWSVTRGTGIQPDSCVTASADALNGRILLILALHPDVREALTAAEEQLLAECLTKDEAADLIRSVLVDLGEVNWELRTDGPIVAPNGRIEEVTRHVEAGCWIYAGTGWTEDGKRMYFIGGK
jgi:hypothetical protein